MKQKLLGLVEIKGHIDMANVSQNFSCFVRIFAAFGLVLLAACTQNAGSVDTALTPQANSQQPIANTTTNETALAAETGQTPAQNVTEAQLTQPSAGLAEDATTSSSEQTQVAALDTTNALTFLPVEGAPQSAITNLSKSLRASAKENGLAVLPSTQTGAKYKVKGYFSALNDGTSTLLVYVWDVIDQGGMRVHRINGQERSGSSNNNPWVAIGNEELERVADRTTSRLKLWVDNKKG